MRVDVTGTAVPAEVWDRFRRPQRWSSWAPHIRAVDCPDPVIAAGTRGVVRGPLGLRLPFVVDAVDAVAHRWSWTVGRRLRLTMHHGVERDTAGSRAWVRLPAVVALPYLPLLRWALTRLVRADLS